MRTPLSDCRRYSRLADHLRPVLVNTRRTTLVGHNRTTLHNARLLTELDKGALHHISKDETLSLLVIAHTQAIKLQNESLQMQLTLNM